MYTEEDLSIGMYPITASITSVTNIRTRKIGANLALTRGLLSNGRNLNRILIALLLYLLISEPTRMRTKATVLMRVCDTKDIKTITNRVCMLYKRTKNSETKIDKFGNIRIARGIKGEYSPAKLASDCCRIGCPPHIFAYNC